MSRPSSSSDPTPASSQSAVARVGKYLMLDHLGSGAFGKVRLAVDETSGQQYAIKIMQKSHIKANELTLQVRREIAVMKAMRHPNIVNLHEVLTSSKNLYMVMDLVTGGELFDAVAESGRLSESRTRLYFQQLVDGVHYCHTRLVFHRDLKPENLLLSADKQTLKITDFGLSSIKSQNASSELLHTIMGSPHYIAPEIITSAAAGYDGSKVDVWASGVILFGMLAGFLPFDEPDTRALYKAVVHNPVTYPPHFSYDVIKLLRAMLQKDPTKRPTMDAIRSFPWFKVDYEPSVMPMLVRKLSAKKAKLRAKGSKRHSERLLRHKRREPSASSTDSGAKPASATNSDTGQQCENLLPETPISKPISQLFKDSSRNSSSSSIARPIPTRHGSHVGPAETTRDIENMQNRLVPAQEPQIPVATLRQSTRGHVSHASSVVAETRSKSRAAGERAETPPEVPDADSLLYGQFSTTAAARGDLAVSATMPLTPGSATVNFSVEAEKPVASPTRRNDMSPSFDGNEAAASAECKVPDGPHLQSPLTPQVSQFSSVHSTSDATGPEERRQESMRFSVNSFGAEKSLNEFVSPMSEFSKSSFSSPTVEKTGPPVMSPNYQSLVPLLFSSEGSGENGCATPQCTKPSTMQSISNPCDQTISNPCDQTISNPSDQTISNPSDQTISNPSDQNTADTCEQSPSNPCEEEKHTVSKDADISADKEISPTAAACRTTADVEGVVEPSPQDPKDNTSEKEMGIFRPMKSLFAQLVQCSITNQPKPSTAPSVFCPEVDYEDHGNPQWCIDSMEVFEDFEADDAVAPTDPKRRSLNLMLSLKQASTPSQDSSTEKEADIEPEKPRSIFAPLDSNLLSQLTPSARDEGKSSKVTHVAPLVRPENVNSSAR